MIISERDIHLCYFSRGGKKPFKPFRFTYCIPFGIQELGIFLLNTNRSCWSRIITILHHIVACNPILFFQRTKAQGLHLAVTLQIQRHYKSLTGIQSTTSVSCSKIFLVERQKQVEDISTIYSYLVTVIHGSYFSGM